MKLKYIMYVSTLVLVACTVPSQSTDSGIEGQVFIGPMCPVVQVGQECPDQPYQAVLTVNSLEGERIVQIQTDEAGKFRIHLEPGDYILHPESPNTLPFAKEKILTVEEGKFTEVIVKYDSGIR